MVNNNNFPVITFVNEEATDCINEEAIGAINKVAIGAIIAPRNPSLCCFISFFTVSLAPAVKRLYFSSTSVLIISSISSVEVNKVNPFPAVTSPLPLIFFPKLFFAFAVAFATKFQANDF